jgi:hypothetical protein
MRISHEVPGLKMISKSENVMGNGDHVAAGLKMQEHPCESACNGAVPLPPENNETEENVSTSATSSRIPRLISAAIRVWELKRGIRQTIE